MKKNFFAAALILSLGVGSFAACSSDDVVPNNGTEQKKTSTYLAMTLKMQAPNASRATDQPYNYIGQWLGQEKIDNVKVYVFETATNTLEAVKTLNSTDFIANQVGADFLIKPKKAIETNPGAKKVYVVVNSNTLTDALLPSTTGTSLATFEAKYKSADLAFADPGVATSGSPADDKEGAAAKVASLDKTGGGLPSQWKNKIVMTGEAATGTIADNVTETAALAGGSNQLSVEVKRLVARTAVTSSAPYFDLTEKDPYAVGHPDVVTGTLSGFTYVAVQSERKVNFLQTQGADNTSDNGTQQYKWDSPAYAFVSNADYSTPGHAIATAARAAYDYAPLWKGDKVANGLLGNKVATQAALNLAQNDANAKVIGELMEGDFVLPTTHKYGSDATTSAYQKGNTAYLLIRTIFQPKKINMDNDPAGAGASRPATAQAAVEFTYSAITASTPAAAPTASTNPAHTTLPDQLVRGENGMYYSSVWASQDPMYNGVLNQAIEVFEKVELGGHVVGYKMLYFAWLNPDNVVSGKWFNSPVYRNNIYHVELNGVTGTGMSWNPLIPADNTNTPGKTPNNPDNQPTIPQVNVPGGPVTPPTPPTPVDPQNPLSPNKTFMSVKTTILPWQVHGYQFKLKI